MSFIANPLKRSVLGARSFPSLALRAQSSSSSTSTSSYPLHPSNIPNIHLGPTHPSRYQDHYNNTLAEDLVYMTYDHNSQIHNPNKPSATALEHIAEDVEANHNPYILNRPTPPPRGNRPLKPLARTTTPTQIPELESIVLHTMIKEAIGNKPAMLNAIMALRAISGETHLGGGRTGSSGVQVLTSKSGAAAFKLRAGMPVAVKVELKGPAMYDFVQSLVDFVLPRLREFPGILLPLASANRNSPSATSGVVAFGLEPAAMALFPQIECNLESYTRMHGFHMQFLTNCRGKGAQDQARALLSGMRIPFTRR